ncbi:MAG: hypothetical protein WC570_01505 [Patescibacteria group bacterium]
MDEFDLDGFDSFNSYDSYDYGTVDYGSGSSDALGGLLAGGLGIGMMIVIFLVWLVIIVFAIYITYRMVKKMGYSGWMVLLVLFFSPIMSIYFAFAKWPVEQEVERLRGGSKTEAKVTEGGK